MLEEKLRTGILKQRTPRGAIQSDMVKDIVGYVNKYDLKIFLGPEWLLLPRYRLYSKGEKEEIICKLADETKDTGALILPGTIMWEDDKFYYNTAPIISGGKVLGEVHKYTNGYSSDRAEIRDCKKEPFITKGKKKPRRKPIKRIKEENIFQWNDYKIGMEICSDEGDIYRAGERSLDLYFLISNGVYAIDKEKLPIKYGGYALNSDGQRVNSIVVQKEKEGIFTCFNEINSNPLKSTKEIGIYDLLIAK